jgi:hypothetical protein
MHRTMLAPTTISAQRSGRAARHGRPRPEPRIGGAFRAQ